VCACIEHVERRAAHCLLGCLDARTHRSAESWGGGAGVGEGGGMGESAAVAAAKDRAKDGEEGGMEGSRRGGGGAWGGKARGGVFVIGASSRPEAWHSQKYSHGNFIASF
jgi:hypothetical protein